MVTLNGSAYSMFTDLDGQLRNSGHDLEHSNDLKMIRMSQQNGKLTSK